MKALKITFEHGRIWTVETSAGEKAQGASLVSALEKVSATSLTEEEFKDDSFDGIRAIFKSIPETGGSGQIARGQASG